MYRATRGDYATVEGHANSAAAPSLFKRASLVCYSSVVHAKHTQCCTQIKAAFEQSEKEVTDLHSRISQEMREAKKNGVKIGLPQGTTLTTKKALECIAIIKKHSKDFGGSLEDPDVIKLCGCSRNSYYKYKKEAKSN